MTMVMMHRETVKAAIRMKFGSIRAFADANELSAQGVRDLLRGTSSTAKDTVAKLLNVDPDHLVITRGSPFVESSSNASTVAHRLIAGAR